MKTFPPDTTGPENPKPTSLFQFMEGSPPLKVNGTTTSFWEPFLSGPKNWGQSAWANCE